MKKISFSTLKQLILLTFIIFSFSSDCFSQIANSYVQFHYNAKTGRFQKGNDVTLTFLLTDIKNSQEYQDLYTAFSKQDGLKKVAMSPFNQTNNSALCSFTFRTPTDSPFKPNYFQKVLVSLGVTKIYYDNDIVETKDIVSYMLTKEKQEHPELSGK